MMPETLPPDPDSVEKWDRLPQNKPSSKALPPLMGGRNQLTIFLIILFILLVLGYLAGRA
jgi:hypothetical protein